MKNRGPHEEKHGPEGGTDGGERGGRGEREEEVQEEKKEEEERGGDGSYEPRHRRLGAVGVAWDGSGKEAGTTRV